MTTSRLVPTPHGDARLHVDRAKSPVATLVLGHGAGGGVAARDLAALARTLPAQGVSVFRVEQPWRVAGRKVASSARILDEAWLAVVNSLRPQTPLVVGGRSAGARVACRTARHLGASGCLAMAFPLHAPGKPDKSRADELTGAGVTTLVVQGDRDSFGAPDAFPSTVDLAVIPGADHGFATLKRGELSQEDALSVLVEAALEWLTREIA
ncbi:MAG TPA: alpha/beta family hydrolase [Nocardioidaceae bacterium]|nr:alpha/beta family hydrolase [Nocardioidaceae bacterium]